MDHFDKYIEKLASEFNIGPSASRNPIWVSYQNKKLRSKTLEDKIYWHKLLISVPSKLESDPRFKKLVYVRYADDWIVGIRGSKDECRMILSKIRIFLSNELKLELSEKKTLITNLRNEEAKFLGTLISTASVQRYQRSRTFLIRTNKEIRLTAPVSTVIKKLTNASFMRNGISSPKMHWLQNSHQEILLLYNSVYRGIIQYYSFASNLNYLSSRIHNVLKSSCAKLLAAKFTLGSQAQAYTKFGKDLLEKESRTSFVKKTKWV
jgi:hypothetical protein